MGLLWTECFCPSLNPNVAAFGEGASKEAIKVK